MTVKLITGIGKATWKKLMLLEITDPIWLWPCERPRGAFNVSQLMRWKAHILKSRVESTAEHLDFILPGWIIWVYGYIPFVYLV